MTASATAFLWRRLDTAGAEHAICTERVGLRARGTMLAATPVPYVCRYEILTDESWATTRCEVTVEGAGFLRAVRLERAAGRWRVTANEQGNLDATLRAAGHARVDQPGCEDPGTLSTALDVDLSGCALTNTLPIRRLGLLDEIHAPGEQTGLTGGGSRPVGIRHSVDVAWVLVPSLEVIVSTQTYQAAGEGIVHFTSGSFSADVRVDERGYVRHYPGLADRA
ncbi:MAG: putative glycolipid-binding domain-containing protein [Micromonosporaceae bacterium]|nr:putative glycolipid-binding domain-containing protein [Micromonosporaceae bacterium]